MEQELKLFRGEWLLVWPEVGWKNWKLRLVTVVPKQLGAVSLSRRVCNRLLQPSFFYGSEGDV